MQFYWMTHDSACCPYLSNQVKQQKDLASETDLPYLMSIRLILKQERIQLNANHPLAASMAYIKFEGM